MRPCSLQAFESEPVVLPGAFLDTMQLFDIFHPRENGLTYNLSCLHAAFFKNLLTV